MEACHIAINEQSLHDSKGLKHLSLLIQYIKDSYVPVTKCLDMLLSRQEITFDLLWALIKPNTYIYTICRGIGKPKYVKYDFGSYKKAN